MRILLSLALIFIFVFNFFGQTKKPTVQVAAQIKILQTQKVNAEEKLKQLQSRYSEEYVEVRSQKSKIENLNKAIAKLLILDSSGEALQILEADLNANDLMKILVVQNQKIIELLEKLLMKK